MKRFSSLLRKSSQSSNHHSMTPTGFDENASAESNSGHTRRASYAGTSESSRSNNANVQRSASQSYPAAPPAYTMSTGSAKSPGRSSRAPLPTVPQEETANPVENPLKTLARYDIVYLVDDSGSMIPLWKQARDALTGIVSKSIIYDKDGIDIFFLNNDRQAEGCTSVQAVKSLFDDVKPRGSTPTAIRLDDLLRPYIDRVEDAKSARVALPKPMVVICITDGRPDDPDTLKDVIIEMAGRLDAIRAPPFQLGIQFLQIGSDRDATAFLRELDDGLKAEHSVRDIVDTVEYKGTLSSDFVIQTCLGAINRRIDSQSH